MYLKHLMTAAVAATLTGTSATFDSDADPVGTDARPGIASTLLMGPTVTQPMQGGSRSEGDASISNLMVSTDGAEPIMSTAGTLHEEEGAARPLVPALYQDQDSYLIGPTWSATRYYSDTEGGLVDVAEDSVITFEIEDDGRFDGHAGCNDYFGKLGPAAVARSAATSVSSFVIAGSVGRTRRMCEEFRVQEAAYLANFEGEVDFSVSRDGAALEVVDPETGSIVAQYTLFAPPILDRSWTATKYYRSEEDGLVDVIPGSVVTLEIEVDEKLSGSAGCNNYVGTYDDLTRNSFAISGPLVSTEMYCGQPGNIMDQERSYLQNFEDRHLQWAIIEDGSLELRDADSGAVVALYNTGSEVVFDPLSASGGMAMQTASAAIIAVVAMAFL